MAQLIHQSRQTPKERLGGARQGKVAMQDNREAGLLQGTLTDDRAVQLAKKPNNTGLPDNLKHGIESLSGMSMDSVKVHFNSSKPAQLNAHAFALGTDIHIAPGQEKHLPHEAWHVVQQAQGRVRPTMQMKGGVPINDSKELEREADVMGGKAVKGPISQGFSPVHGELRGTTNSPIQRQNAQQAGLLGGYVAGADANLYNARGGIGLPLGTLFSFALPPVGGTAAVLDAYTLATRPYAGPLAARQFLDAPNNPQDPPSVANWGANGANYITSLENWLQAPAGTLAAMAPPGGTRANAANFKNNLATNRDSVRNNPAYGLVDPFIAQLTIPVAGAAAPWIIQTNFSNASFGYIIDINVGPHNVHGQIAPSLGDFNAMSAQVPGVGNLHTYSPGHDELDQNTVGTQIGTVAPGASHGANHLGLDAVTKLAAEGARFEPVRQLGTNLKLGSRFFAIDHDTNRVKYLDFKKLYQRWGTWFGRAYAIPSTDVRREVLAHGRVLDRPLDLPSDYDTDAGAVAQTKVGDYTASIQYELQTIEQAKQKKLNYARGKGPRKQAAVAAYNRGQNQVIDAANHDLKRYQAMVPQLVAAIRHPPPIVAVVPLAGGPVGGVVAPVGGGLAPPAANNNALRQILVNGVLIAVVVAVFVLFGPNGLLSNGSKPPRDA